MKPLFRVVAFFILTASLTVASIAQNKESKDEQFNKIVKLSQSKKAEDQEKTYQMGREFVAQFGKDNDDKVKKIKDFNAKYRMNAFLKAVDDIRMADALRYGKEILADEPENSSVTLNLAYGSFQASVQKKDKSFHENGINYAKQTLTLFEAGKLPKNFEPLKDQADAKGFLYYAIGSFLLDKDLKEAAKNFYQATQIESQFKRNVYAYNNIAVYYERSYETLAKDFQAKHAAKTSEDAAMKADREKLDAIADRMIDVYARLVKLSETEDNPNKEAWKTRLVQVYKYRKQSETGMNELVASVLNTPLPDPTSL